MFKREMGLLSLSEPPSEEFIENTLLDLIERIYKKAFVELYEMPESDRIDVRYEDFVKDPMYHLEKIYTQLELDGFEEAKPYFEEYINSMDGYKTNRYLPMDGTMIRKINEKLGFYFARYGYSMRSV